MNMDSPSWYLQKDINLLFQTIFLQISKVDGMIVYKYLLKVHNLF